MAIEEKKIHITASSVASYSYCSKRWKFDDEYSILQNFRKGLSIENISGTYGIPKEHTKQILKKYKLIKG